MGHPLIDEFCRQAGELRPDFFRRCQRVFRDEVQPVLDEAEALRTENARLQQEIARLQIKSGKHREATTAASA